MGHGIIRGVKHQVVHGPKHNVNVLGGGSLALVTRDATSLIYVPSTNTEWNSVMAVAGASRGAPTSIYTCQEASGSLNDVNAVAALTQSGTGHLYAQAVSGWTRTAATTVDATVGQKWINSTTAPNPNTTSTLWLAYVRFPAAAPAAARDLMANSGTLDVRLASTGRLTGVNGSSVTGTNSHLGLVFPVILKHDNTNSVCTLYTSLEKFSMTYAAVASNPMFVLGGQTTSAGDLGYLYSAVFSGSAAEWTDSETRTILLTLGWTVIW